MEYIEGQTPIDEDEKEGLRIRTISTRGELDEFEPDEIAIRLKHRLVKTHIFPNGNGRHSRLCADILIMHGYKRPAFSWGKTSLSKKGETRKRYLNAIYQADKGILEPLIEFARS